ncbi:hypothetical protein [Planosporangium thailandense]|nr:hypothetical protein [Planosporangium thailandense]
MSERSGVISRLSVGAKGAYELSGPRGCAVRPGQFAERSEVPS